MLIAEDRRDGGQQRGVIGVDAVVTQIPLDPLLNQVHVQQLDQVPGPPDPRTRETAASSRRRQLVTRAVCFWFTPALES